MSLPGVSPAIGGLGDTQETSFPLDVAIWKHSFPLKEKEVWEWVKAESGPSQSGSAVSPGAAVAAVGLWPRGSRDPSCLTRCDV